MIIDPKSHVPIFRQIADQLCRGIESGVYRAGEALPSQRALAADLRVNPNTVQRAIDELLRDGVVESRRGLGVYVVGRHQGSPSGGTERDTAIALRSAVKSGLAAGLTPTRLRQLFESEMRRHVANVSRQS